MTTATRTALLRRRTTTAAAALLLGLALAACGGGSDEPDDRADESSTTEAPVSSSDEPTADDDSTEETEPTETTGDVPSEEELAAALLTVDDLPEGFAVDTDEQDSDDDTFEGTCLAEVGEFSDALGFEADSEAEVEFVAESQTGQSLVDSKIQAYADPAAVAPAFADFTETLQSCTSVSATDDDGVTFDLGIVYDETVDIPGADDQLRMEISGTIGAGAETFDFVYEFVVALSGPYISIVGASSLGDAVLAPIDLLAPAQAERVATLG